MAHRALLAELQGLAGKFPQFASGARGRGLLLGLTLTEKGIAHGAEIVNRMFERGLIINFTGNQVLRFVPPPTQIGRASCRERV